MTTSRTDLAARMEIDHVIRVAQDGSVTDGPAGVHGPELYAECDADGQHTPATDPGVRAQAQAQGWELLTTSGHGWRYGPLLPSHLGIGGRLADDILAQPGLYVAVVVTEDDGSEPSSWAVAHRPDTVTYVATVNTPGHLPHDDDPPVFDSAREAWAYLAGERERAEDDLSCVDGDCPDGTADCPWNYANDATTTLTELREIAEGIGWADHGIDPDGQGTILGATPGYHGTHDLGQAYSVTVTEG